MTLKVCPVSRCQFLKKCRGRPNLYSLTRLSVIGVWSNFGEREVHREVKVANSRKQFCRLCFNYVVSHGAPCINAVLLAVKCSLNPKYPPVLK